MNHLYIIEDTPGDGSSLVGLALLCGFHRPVRCTLATALTVIATHSGDLPGVVIAGGSVARHFALVSLERAALSFSLPTLIHPTATISPFANLAKGVIVFADAIVNPAASIGQCVTIYNAAVVEHDNVIESFVTIGSESAFGGNVTVGVQSAIGDRVTINQGVTVGRCCLIHSDTAVVSEVFNYQIVRGVPGRVCPTE